jgi:mannosyltransferase
VEADLGVEHHGLHRYEAVLQWALPLAVAFAAVAISAPGALSNAMWSDEIASARIVTEPDLGSVLEGVRQTESTPPAWYVLAWSVSKVDDGLTGGALFVPVERLRLLSVLFAAIASALTMLWALRLLGDRLLAALAGLLVALGSIPALYAEHLRAYALLMLMSVVFGLLLMRVSSRPETWSWSALAVCVWIGVLTHYFFFLTAGAGAVWLWARRTRLPGSVKATTALAVGVLGFVPWLSGFLDQKDQGLYHNLPIGGFEIGAVAELPGRLFFGPDGVLYGLARIAVSVALVVGVVVMWRRRGGTEIVALALLPVAGAALVWALGEPVFNERNLLSVAPYIAILVAAAISALPGRLVAPAAVMGIAAAVAGAAWAQATLGRIEYDRVADALVEEGWTANDPILINAPRAEASAWIAVGWYLPGAPILTRVRHAENRCVTLFVVGHESTLTPWLGGHGSQFDAVRELKSYDRPHIGRENGHILVARVRNAIDLRGKLFRVRGRDVPCLRRGS